MEFLFMLKKKYFCDMEFLKAIASAYAARYADMGRFLFIFPNKRSCTFFRKYLGECGLTAYRKQPRTMAVTDFVAEVSQRRPASKTELLFILYDEYRKINPQATDFDRFRGWADIVISDFSDVDMYGADPDMLFKNVADWNEIQTDFLTAEQREVMRDYFGFSYDPAEATKSFWKHYVPAEGKEGYQGKNRFMQLWQRLAALYHAMDARLEKEGLSYSGMAYRVACQRLRENPLEAVPYDRVVFVGFNVLPSLQYRMFDILSRVRVKEKASALNAKYASEAGKEVAFADFYWDCTGPALSDSENTATYFVHRNKMKFRSRFDISASDTDSYPEVMRVLSAPSNSIQAKLAGEIIDSLTRDGVVTSDNAERTAIVLPDEHLLIPLLYSLPPTLKERNLTMGLPLRLSLTASLVCILRRMYSRARNRGGGTAISFFYEDVESVLSHPLSRMLVAEPQIDAAVQGIADQRLYMVTHEWINENLPTLSGFFIPITKDASAAQGREYIGGVLGSVAEALAAVDTDVARSEKANIDAVEEMAAGIIDSIGRYAMNISADSFMRMLEKEINAATLRLEGEPLTGLQIMGTLETRCLDFENIIIPSLNERVFPQRMQTRSFIPNNLRRGFGLPTTQFRECVFAYYFYRMISRARRVYMIYDARSGGLKSADPSRYLQQLRYLYPDCGLVWDNRRFEVKRTELPDLFVRKNERVMKELECFTTQGDNGRNLSASALTTYMSCPLKFYFQYVHHLREVLPPEEFINAIGFGNVFHETMQEIYSPGNPHQLQMQGRLVTPEVIDLTLNNPGTLQTRIARLVMYETNKRRSGEPRIDDRFFADIIGRYVVKTLRADRALAEHGGGFVYHGSEVSGSVRYDYAPGSTVNLKFIIDRVDAPGNTPGTIRLSDYKTGIDKFDVETLADSLDNDNSAHVVFQLFLYARLLRMKFPEFTDGRKLSLSVYNVRDKAFSAVENYVKVGGQPVTDASVYDDEFTAILNNLISEIMNPEVDFVQAAPGARSCKYCPFAKICGR